MIDPAVTIDINRRPADIGRMLHADQMPHPHIGALKLEPENTLLRVAATGDKIQIAVAIHIYKRCLTVGVTRQIAIDEVMSESQFAVVVVDCSPRRSVVLWLSGATVALAHG